MEVNEVLTRAWSEVRKAELPPELHGIALQEAVRLISSPSPSQEQTLKKRAIRSGRRRSKSEGHESHINDSSSDAVPTPSEETFLTKVAEHTGVQREKLEELFHLSGGNPQFNYFARRLGSTAKARMTTVAQVIPVLRQYGLDEDETSTKVIRHECARLKCLDEKNVNTYLSRLEGVTYTGPATDKKLKVRAAGIQAFTRIVDQLLSQGPGHLDAEQSP